MSEAKVPEGRCAPAQEKVSEEIKVLKSQFFNMQSLENSGLSLVSSKDMTALKKNIRSLVGNVKVQELAK